MPKGDNHDDHFGKDEAGTVKSPPKLVPENTFAKFVEEVRNWTLYTEVKVEKQAPLVASTSCQLGSEKRSQAQAWLKRNLQLSQRAPAVDASTGVITEKGGVGHLLEHSETQYVADDQVRLFEKLLAFLLLIRLAGEKVVDFLNRLVEAKEDLKGHGFDMATAPKLMTLPFLRGLQIGLADLRGRLKEAGDELDFEKVKKHVQFVFMRRNSDERSDKVGFYGGGGSGGGPGRNDAEPVEDVFGLNSSADPEGFYGTHEKMGCSTYTDGDGQTWIPQAAAYMANAATAIDEEPAPSLETVQDFGLYDSEGGKVERSALVSFFSKFVPKRWESSPKGKGSTRKPRIAGTPPWLKKKGHVAQERQQSEQEEQSGEAAFADGSNLDRFNCGRKGHRAANCPDPPKKGQKQGGKKGRGKGYVTGLGTLGRLALAAIAPTIAKSLRPTPILSSDDMMIMPCAERPCILNMEEMARQRENLVSADYFPDQESIWDADFGDLYRHMNGDYQTKAVETDYFADVRLIYPLPVSKVEDFRLPTDGMTGGMTMDEECVGQDLDFAQGVEADYN